MRPPSRENFTAGVGHQKGLLELSGPLAISGDGGPVVGPALVPPRALTYHGLDGEAMAGFHHSDRFVLSVMWHLRRGVEEPVNA